MACVSFDHRYEPGIAPDFRHRPRGSDDHHMPIGLCLAPRHSRLAMASSLQWERTPTFAGWSEPFDPRMAIQAQVTRTGFNGETGGADRRISVDEAIKVGTLNGAYNTHEEGIKGSITPGKLADYVVLAKDPHTITPSKIKDVQIVRTVEGGNTVYQA